MSTETLANLDALALILGRICIYQFCNRLDSLTLINARAVTFKTCCNKVGAHDLLDCIVVPVTRNRYSHSLLLFIRIIHQFSLLFVQYYSLFDFCFIFI